MRVAYLIDHDGVGGGMEYIRRQISAHSEDESRVFFSERGECAAAKMNDWGADVLHCNHLKALLQLFRNPLVKPKGKVVFTVHGIHLRKYDFLPKTPMNRFRRWMRLSLERWLYRKCDRLIALTETDAKDIRRLYGGSLPVEVVSNTVNPSEFSADSRIRYRPDEFAFVCIARFDFQKGQDVLISAAALAQDALRKARRRILMIGGGGTFDKVRHAAESRGVADIFEFAGEIPHAGAYMTCARHLVAPSRWEGMPYLLLEAVARGRSIIASDCPGNRDVLKGYSKASMFPVEDVARLAQLLESAKI